MKATIQICTFNRAPVLDRVLDACFEQNTEEPYEIVLVNDGSIDNTAEVIESAQRRASCPLVVVTQPNGGLAKARNAGIARSSGERIIFIDDDVLPLPNFVAEHLRSHSEHPAAIVRGVAITTQSLDELPPPRPGLRDYSGNYFWTTNVSVPLQTIREVGGFNESFAEYGWEDIDVGLRLRFLGVRAITNSRAIVFHYKPPLHARDLEKMLRQARAQARTAVQLAQLHPHWRTYLATGDNPVQRAVHSLVRTLGLPAKHRSELAKLPDDAPLAGKNLYRARRLAAEEYFAELERTR